MAFGDHYLPVPVENPLLSPKSRQQETREVMCIVSKTKELLMFSPKVVHLLVLFPCLLFCFGCQKNPYGVSKVTGIVTFDGEPVKGASVTFIPKDKEFHSASGMTNEKGEFLLTTAGAEGGSGAQPGDYSVAIRKVRLPDDLQIETPGGSAMIGVGAGAQPVLDVARMQVDQLPEKYKSAETSGLEVVVEKSKKNHYIFELTSQ